MKNMNASNAVAMNIRAELARRRVSQHKLAQHLGKSQTWVHRRLSGNVSLSINDIMLIADFLGLPITELLGAKDSAALAGAGEAS